jgi:hypothetical protein
MLNEFNAYSVDTDRRPQYIWLFAILANVPMYLFIVIEVMDFGNFGMDAFLYPLIHGQNLIFLLISMVVSLVPTYLSGVQATWSRYVGFGFPALIILYSVWHFSTCEGKFCNMIDIPFGIAGSLFGLFYALAVSLRKRSEKIVVSILTIEILLLMGGLAYAMNGSHSNSESQTKVDTVSEVASPEDAAKLCDSIPLDSEYRGDCWVEATHRYPNTDMCAWSTVPEDKEECLFYQGIVYRENLEFGCEHKDSQISYNLKDTPDEITRLRTCWSDKSSIYTELDLCVWAYEWNKDRCYEFLDTVPQ